MSSMFPLTGAAEDLWFQTSQYTTAVTSLLSCTRASSGYAKNADGTLTSFGTNTLRIGVGTGLLVEDARTNIIQRSQEADNATWTSNEITFSADSTNAPDGTATADKLIPSTNNTDHYILQSQSGSAGATTYSVYAKNAGYNFCTLTADNNGNADRYKINVNLTTGAIVDTSSSGSPASPSATTELLANGWVRISVTVTVVAGGLRMVLIVYNAATPAPFAGDGSSGIYLWGAQIEAGSFVSSYIPTTTVAVTRAADAVSCTGSLNTVLTALPQSAVVDIAYLSTPTTDARIIGQSSGAISLLYSRSNDTTLGSYAGGSEITPTLGNSLTFSGGVKVGAAEATTSRSAVGGGGTVATESGPTNTVMTSPYVGSLGGSSPYSYAYFRRLTVWNTKLADVTLQQLTDPTSAFYAEPTTLFAQACM